MSKTTTPKPMSILPFKEVVHPFSDTLSRYMAKSTFSIQSATLFGILKTLAGKEKPFEDGRIPEGAVFLQSIGALHLLTLQCALMDEGGFDLWLKHMDPFVRGILEGYIEYQKTQSEESPTHKIEAQKMLTDWIANLAEHYKPEKVDESEVQ